MSIDLHCQWLIECEIAYSLLFSAHLPIVPTVFNEDLVGAICLKPRCYFTMISQPQFYAGFFFD